MGAGGGVRGAADVGCLICFWSLARIERVRSVCCSSLRLSDATTCVRRSDSVTCAAGAPRVQPLLFWHRRSVRPHLEERRVDVEARHVNRARRRGGFEYLRSIPSAALHDQSAIAGRAEVHAPRQRHRGSLSARAKQCGLCAVWCAQARLPYGAEDTLTDRSVAGCIAIAAPGAAAEAAAGALLAAGDTRANDGFATTSICAATEMTCHGRACCDFLPPAPAAPECSEQPRERARLCAVAR